MATAAAVLTRLELAEGDRIVLTCAPFEGAAVIVKCVDEDGTVTGTLVNPLVVERGDYELPAD